MHGLREPWIGDEDDPANRAPKYQDMFVEDVVRIMTDEEAWTEWHRAALVGAETLDWSHLVLQWDALAPARTEATERAAGRPAAVTA
jgi:hypothetical protein